jgi:hypothetical protein
MATITAALNVSSDISSYGLTINNTMTMTKAGSTVGLERTSSLQRVHLTNKRHVDLLVRGSGTVADMTVTKAAKVYIKYLEADTSKHVTIGLGDAKNNADLASTANTSDSGTFFELGKLYGDEWMIIPWSGTSATGDITVHPSSATTADPAIVEYIVFFD